MTLDHVALAGSVLAMMWSGFTFFWSRHRMSRFEVRTAADKDREQFRSRLNDAVGFAIGSTGRSQSAGVTMLTQLFLADFVADDDRLTVAAVLDSIVEA